MEATTRQDQGHSRELGGPIWNYACSVLFMVTTICLGCRSTADPASDIAAATVPSGGAVPTISAMAAESHSRRYDWEFETRLDWSAYCDWVTNQFENKLRVRARDGSSIVFTGLGTGDAFHLEVRQIRRGPAATQVHAVLTMAPD